MGGKYKPRRGGGEGWGGDCSCLLDLDRAYWIVPIAKATACRLLETSLDILVWTILAISSNNPLALFYIS